MIVFNNLPNNSIQESDLLEWMSELFAHYNQSRKLLVYNFVSEEDLLTMNQTYLDHHTHTDIITFSYDTAPLKAEVFISTSRMIENAEVFGQTIENEMIRLISHGFLHAIGYHDKTKKEKSIMTHEEDRCIKMFHVKQMKNV